MDLRIGISGWTYEPWRGIFFPPDLKQKEELGYASRQVNSIEINGTFYSLQRPSSYASWSAQVPENFVFSVKAPRFVTHIKRLEDVRLPVANFFASGVLRLEEKLGPLLWQLPPSLPYDRKVLQEFFELLPRDTTAAATLAKEHDDHLRGPAWLKAGPKRPLRHALEVRNKSFEKKEFLDLLRDNGIAIVVADTAGKWPLIEEVTADFVYVRLHGDEVLYASGYTAKALKTWEAKIRRWNKTKDVYVYFDNDVKVKSPYDAMTLAHNLGIGPKPGPAPTEEQVRHLPPPRTTSPEWVRRRKKGLESGTRRP